jgi:MarR family transcriptional repressor of mepA
LEQRRSLGKSIRLLNNLLMRRFDMARPDREALSRITGTNRWLIGYLVEQRKLGRDVYQKDLEAAFGVTRSTISKVLDRMVEKGLIERLPVARDARLKRLSLTPKALKLSEKMRAYAEGVEREIVAGFTDEELERFHEYIDRARKNLGEL